MFSKLFPYFKSTETENLGFLMIHCHPQLPINQILKYQPEFELESKNVFS